MATVTIRYWAAAREAAGVAEEAVEARTLAEALAAASSHRGTDRRFREVLARSSFLVDGASAGARPAAGVAVGEGSVIEVLPPFAGG
ncbi:MAG TPA: MoaD/ThiS family protein [Streptosporangiaceae bacterium]|nr:MoaD/ThiS family protein [Streptosporangiaceae bacterium]